MKKSLIRNRLKSLVFPSQRTVPMPARETLHCIWTDGEIVVLEGDGKPPRRGPAELLLPNFGNRKRSDNCLMVHYQGSDLLVLPPLPHGQSRMTWLQRHLPPGHGLADYLLSFSAEGGSDATTAMLPKERVIAIFAAVQAAGFAEAEIVAFPGDLQEPTCLLLASGTWRIDPKGHGQIHAIPLPNQCDGSPPPWLKPQGPLLDLTETPFAQPVFRWEDVLAQQRKTQRKNRRFLFTAAAILLLGFTIAWLAVGWQIRRTEDALVTLSLQQKNQVSALQGYQQSKDQLTALYQQMEAHPFSHRSQTLATSVRNWLSVFPESLILGKLRYLKEDGQAVCFLEGFSTDGLEPMSLIRGLEQDLPEASIDLIQLNQLPEKQRISDPRLANNTHWLQFTIRMGDL